MTKPPSNKTKQPAPKGGAAKPVPVDPQATELQPTTTPIEVEEWKDEGPTTAKTPPKSTDVSDEIKKNEAQSIIDARRRLLDTILPIFIGTNVVVLLAVAVAWGFDISGIKDESIEPEDRLITENVMLALIAATTAQVGAIVASIALALFPRKSNN